MTRSCLVAAASLALVGGCTVVAPPEPAVVTAGAAPAASAPPPGSPPATVAPARSAASALKAPPPPDVPVPDTPAPDTPPAADAPMEVIVVSAPGLSGYWAVNAAQAIDVQLGLFSGVRVVYSSETGDRDICLLRQHGPRLAATCSSGLSPTAEGAMDGQQVTLRWWNGPANLIFDGSWDEAGTIQGSISGGLAGLSVTGAIPATLRKLAADGGEDPASAASLRGVLDDLRHGALTEARYEAAGLKRVRPSLAWPGARAASQTLTYLGRIHVRWRKDQPDLPQDVYAVRRSEQLALCRIGLSERGRVVDFGCQDAI